MRRKPSTALFRCAPLRLAVLGLLAAVAAAGTARADPIGYFHTVGAWPQQHTNGLDYAVMDVAEGQVVNGVVSPAPPPDSLSPTSIRFEVRPGDKWRGSTGERSQLATERSFYLEPEGTDRWYSEWVYAPSCCWPARASFLIPTQNHSAAVQAEVQWDFRNTLQLFAPDPVTGGFGDPLGDWGRRLDEWNFMLWHVRYSADPTRGLIEAWVNGVPSLRHEGPTLLGPTDLSYQLIGIYRGDSPRGPDGLPVGPTDVVFHNGYTMYDADPRSISVSPDAVVLPVNGTQAFTADVRTGYGPTAWSATCGTIDAAGTYTAPPTPGICTVTASNNGVSARAAVSVEPTEVEVTPETATVRAGEVERFLARVTNPLGPTVWTADGGVVDEGGAYTAGRVPGVYAVTATNNGASDQASVTVVPWLGTDVVGTEGWNAASTDAKRCSVFTAAGGGLARGLVVHYRGSSATAGRATLRGVLYAAPDGEPGALVRATVPREVAAGDPARWATLGWADGGTAALVDGRRYCLGFVAAGDPWVIEYPFDRAGVQFANPNPDGNPPSDPFGPAGTYDKRESVYVDLAPVGTAPQRRALLRPVQAKRVVKPPPRIATRAASRARDTSPRRRIFRPDRRVARVVP